LAALTLSKVDFSAGKNQFTHILPYKDLIGVLLGSKIVKTYKIEGFLEGT
jgi:hypothetical protein